MGGAKNEKSPPAWPEPCEGRQDAFASTQVEPVKTSQSDQFTNKIENHDVQRS